MPSNQDTSHLLHLCTHLIEPFILRLMLPGEDHKQVVPRPVVDNGPIPSAAL